MTITLKIDNPDIEEQLKQFVYKKRDPRKYSRIIKREYNPEDVDEVALLHIKDSAKYVHDLRRVRNR